MQLAQNRLAPLDRASPLALGFLLGAAAAACGGHDAGWPSPIVAEPTAAAPHRPDTCPLNIEGVSADIETTGRGVTVSLSASPDQLMLLRARAAAATGLPGGLLAACPCGSLPEGGAAPAAQVSLEDFEGGTRIIISARDPADAKPLAGQVRSQLALVHAGECPRP
jgi:hypothetical protein